MRKIIAAINVTLDGVYDHTAGIPDADLHDHYTELLQNAGVILYGRKTYQLMEYWRTVLENPSEEESMKQFAAAIDKIPKIVFSRTIENVDWKTASVANRDLQAEVSALRAQPGKEILIGSRSLILQLIKLNLVDELQLCIHPVVAGRGETLFEDFGDRKLLDFVQSKSFPSGIIIHYYALKK